MIVIVRYSDDCGYVVWLLYLFSLFTAVTVYIIMVDNCGLVVWLL